MKEAETELHYTSNFHQKKKIDFHHIFCACLDPLVDSLAVLWKTTLLVCLLCHVHLILSHCEFRQELSASFFFVFKLYKAICFVPCKSQLKDLTGLAMQAQLELQIMDNILSWCIIFTIILGSQQSYTNSCHLNSSTFCICTLSLSCQSLCLGFCAELNDIPCA